MRSVTTVLLIEDDDALGAQVKRHLEEAGSQVVWWKKGRLIDPADVRSLALVVLDLMLPGVAGLDILKDLRTRSDVPVLVLSARQDGRDKVRALQLGADDYVTKPFWPEELVERVRARLRRPALHRSGLQKVGALELDDEQRTANYQRRSLELTKVEFDLLHALMKRADQAVSRAWILSNVLDPERDATERTLDVHVSRLRKKLGEPELIETVWGIGYRLRSRR